MIAKQPKFVGLQEANEDALTADGFEDAYLGYVVNHHRRPVAVYDYDLCRECLTRDGMTDEEAEDYLSFNVLGAYVGEDGPLFVQRDG
jgi:hypothetical protein